MKTITISKLVHITVMLTFLLPFFYTGCGAVKNEGPFKDSDTKVKTSSKEGNLKDSNKIINSTDTSRIASNVSASKDSTLFNYKKQYYYYGKNRMQKLIEYNEPSFIRFINNYHFND